MRRSLICHSASPSTVVSAVQVSLQLIDDDTLALSYEFTAQQAQVLLPQPNVPVFANELWKHTCFELFVAGSGHGYREYNFSPSSAWAAYEFSDYRMGMAPLMLEQPPAIHMNRQRMQVRLPLVSLPSSSSHAIGLAAVIEECDGRLSYWALKHPSAKPDFHHRSSFIGNLPVEHAPSERPH